MGLSNDGLEGAVFIALFWHSNFDLRRIAISHATHSKELTCNENGMLKGKKGIIFGAANDHSLAWACAKALYSEGADLGFRVNSISAKPVRTLAATWIVGFRDMLKFVEQRAPLKPNLQAEEVGKTALYLTSDLASGVTGECIHDDCGYSFIAL